MSQKSYNHKSEKTNKEYEIRGSHFSGYRATDKTTGQGSVYATDTLSEMKSHITKVESGTRIDVYNFGLSIDEYRDKICGEDED